MRIIFITESEKLKKKKKKGERGALRGRHRQAGRQAGAHVHTQNNKNQFMEEF